MKINVYNMIFDRADEFFVQLNLDLIDKIKGKIESNFPTLSEYNRKFVKINPNTFNYFFQKNRKTRRISRLKKICKNIEVERNEIYEKIKGFYAKGSHGGITYLPEILEINETFVEGYSLYIGEGDFGSNGEKTPKKVRMTNSNLNVIKFFVDWLREFFPRISFSIKIDVPIGKAISQERVKDVAEKLEVEKTRINTRPSKQNKRLVYRVWADNIILMRLLLNLEREVKEMALLDKEAASSYIRGLMMGEGTARHKNFYRYVRMEMKNKKEINFTVNLLDKLGIDCQKYRRSDNSGRHWIHIGERTEIEKFNELVGFGVHDERQEILNDCINSYEEKHFKRGKAEEIYLECVHNLRKRKKKVTVSIVSEEVDRSVSVVKHRLKKFFDAGLLSRKRNTSNFFEYKITESGLDKIKSKE